MSNEIWMNPMYGVTLTVSIYVFSVWLQRKISILHPLFLTSILLIGVTAFTGTYEQYQVGGDMITFLLGPATIALGVPLYKHFKSIQKKWRAISVGVIAGSVSGMASAGLFVWLFHGSREVLLSMLAKSATTPISMEITRQLGGIPELGAVLTVLTGLAGSLFGPQLLKWVRINKDEAIGTAIGTSSHGIGTARIIRESEYQGSVSSLTMALTGIITSILAIPLYWWIGS